MAETLKARKRRIQEGFFERYIYGKKTIDVGCGISDTIDGMDLIYPFEIFNLFDKDNKWFWDKGTDSLVCAHDKHICDAAELDICFGFNSVNTVYASHVLEHLNNPIKAIKSWFNTIKEGGHIIISVPHRDLYEKQELLPSRWNADHKYFILPDESYPPHTFSLKSIIQTALRGCNYQIESISVANSSTNANNYLEHSNGEYSIEATIYKLITK